MLRAGQPIPRKEAIPLRANISSQRVAERLGLRFIGSSFRFAQGTGEAHGARIYVKYVKPEIWPVVTRDGLRKCSWVTMNRSSDRGHEGASAQRIRRG